MHSLRHAAPHWQPAAICEGMDGKHLRAKCVTIITPIVVFFPTNSSYSAHDVTIPARGKGICPTDLAIAVPDNCYGRVAARSGLAVKNSIDVGAGVIDADYRGNVGIVLFNHGDQPFEVKRGDRVAQLICERIVLPELQEVEALTETVRGEAGFGSTGVQ